MLAGELLSRISALYKLACYLAERAAAGERLRSDFRLLRLYPECRCKTTAAAPRRRESSPSLVIPRRGGGPASIVAFNSACTRGPNLSHEAVMSPVIRITSGDRVAVTSR